MHIDRPLASAMAETLTNRRRNSDPAITTGITRGRGRGNELRGRVIVMTELAGPVGGRGAGRGRGKGGGAHVVGGGASSGQRSL